MLGGVSLICLAMILVLSRDCEPTSPRKAEIAKAEKKQPKASRPHVAKPKNRTRPSPPPLLKIPTEWLGKVRALAVQKVEKAPCKKPPSGGMEVEWTFHLQTATGITSRHRFKSDKFQGPPEDLNCLQQYLQKTKLSLPPLAQREIPVRLTLIN